MRPETLSDLAKRAGELIAAEFDGVLSTVPIEQMGSAIAALIRKAAADGEVWNPAWDF